jgi:SAM-dependent methyltransferase
MPWEREADIYMDLLTTSPEEVHFGVGVPGNNELQLIECAKPGQSVLDVGCGSGENLLALARLGYSVTGVDPSRRQLGHASTLFREHGVHATLLELAAERVAELVEQFDVVVSVGALHFCSDIAGVIQGISQVIKPGGTFVLSMPHPIDMLSDYEVAADRIDVRMNSYFPSGQRIRGSRYWAKFGGKEPTGYHFDEYVYTISGLIEALSGAGFRLRSLLEPECRHEPWYPCLFKDPDPIFLTRYCASVPQYLILVAELDLGASSTGDVM